MTSTQEFVNVPYPGAPEQRKVQALGEAERDGIWRYGDGFNAWRWNDAKQLWEFAIPYEPFWLSGPIESLEWDGSPPADDEVQWVELVRLGSPAWVFTVETSLSGFYFQVPEVAR